MKIAQKGTQEEEEEGKRDKKGIREKDVHYLTRWANGPASFNTSSMISCLFYGFLLTFDTAFFEVFCRIPYGSVFHVFYCSYTFF